MKCNTAACTRMVGFDAAIAGVSLTNAKVRSRLGVTIRVSAARRVRIGSAKTVPRCMDMSPGNGGIVRNMTTRLLLICWLDAEQGFVAT